MFLPGWGFRGTRERFEWIGEYLHGNCWGLVCTMLVRKSTNKIHITKTIQQTLDASPTLFFPSLLQEDALQR